MYRGGGGGHKHSPDIKTRASPQRVPISIGLIEREMYKTKRNRVRSHCRCAATATTGARILTGSCRAFFDREGETYSQSGEEEEEGEMKWTGYKAARE